MCQPETTLKDIYFAILNTVQAEANISWAILCIMNVILLKCRHEYSF